MNGNEAASLLDRAARTLIPDEPAPVPALLDAAQRGRRRRTRNTLTLAAAFGVFVVGGGAVIHQVTTERANEPPPGQDAVEPTAPAKATDVSPWGRWQLRRADIKGRELTVTRDVVDLIMQDGSASAFTKCASLRLAPPHVDGNELSLTWRGSPTANLACFESFPALDYFNALTAIQVSLPTTDALVLTGPGVVLKFERAP